MARFTVKPMGNGWGVYSPAGFVANGYEHKTIESADSHALMLNAFADTFDAVECSAEDEKRIDSE